MNLEDLKKRECQWLGRAGRDSHISLCSRVRLARNIKGVPFPGKASGAQLDRIAAAVLEAAGRAGLLDNALVVRMAELETADRQFLAERHLVSREFAGSGAGVVVIGEEEKVSIMINEEDHLRIQVMQPGFQAYDAWRKADELDDELGRELSYAYSGEWGFLTSCPTNAGTGLRASIMLHLPALVASKRIVKVLSRLASSGATPRGAYGEGSEPAGNLFQISNQATLGAREEDIIRDMEASGEEVIEEEENARSYFLNENTRNLQDRVFRAYGILRNARLMSSSEALEHLSSLKLGVQTGVLAVSEELINRLIISVQPAHLQKTLGVKLSEKERDRERADFIRKRLAEAGGTT